jgi:glycosyltransferase involved in cell wall biosynthesis
MYLLESMASGVPVVQPALGAFPEIVEKSGGGINYTPNTPESLSEALSSLLGNQEKLNKLSEQGRKGVEQKFNVHQEAKDVVDRYSKLTNKTN